MKKHIKLYNEWWDYFERNGAYSGEKRKQQTFGMIHYDMARIEIPTEEELAVR